ncbi:MAG: HlyD family efflux transporter periplasmic adaptor subunit [Oscillospiraceae bacterium]|jgi:multidrug efflux pump subunit AcrA (membrane-fusion protein)|nr:HlyD family efflux transporter periplasmic adaptor subunit [Oscillospiraceae bacterium]
MLPPQNSFCEFCKKSIAVVLPLLFLSFASCGGSAASGEEALLLREIAGGKPTNHKTATVALGTLSRKTSGEGVAYYPKKDALTCPFDNAVLGKLNVSNNTTVKKGDIIAEFEISYSASELSELYSNLEIIKKQHNLQKAGYISAAEAAEERLENISALYTSGGATKNEVKKAELLLEKARLSLDYFTYQYNLTVSEQQKKIDSFEASIKNNVIYAPYDGVISDLSYLVPGATIPRSTFICSIYSKEDIWLSAALDTANGMRYNKDVVITVTNHGKTYTGRIVSAPNIRGETTGYVTIIPDEAFQFDPADRMKRITVSALRYELNNVPVLPSAAVNNEDGKRYVYLFEDGIVKKRYVTCGINDISSIQILEGLELGETVIIY